MTSEDLQCKIECHDVLVQLCSALDRCAMTEAVEFFTDDATLVIAGAEISGRAAHEHLLERSNKIVTRHILTNVFVTPTAANMAKGDAYIVVYRLPRQDGDALPRRLPATPQAAGDLMIEFRKTAKGWRVSRYAAVALFEAAPAAA